MELVTLAHIKLNRIGSASSSGFGLGNRQQRIFITEISDNDAGTLRQAVIEIAEENGESPGSLNNLRREGNVGALASHVILNIQGPNTQYGLPYAECQVIPALKINGRYFELKEVETNGSTHSPRR